MDERPIVAAAGLRRRLFGLALRRRQPDHALLIPHCRSVHTIGMHFPLDLIWLDEFGDVLAIDERVPPRRVRSLRAAAAVIETPAGGGDQLAIAWERRSQAYRKAALE
jgi:uncharacterized protein